MDAFQQETNKDPAICQKRRLDYSEIGPLSSAPSFFNRSHDAIIMTERMYVYRLSKLIEQFNLSRSQIIKKEIDFFVKLAAERELSTIPDIEKCFEKTLPESFSETLLRPLREAVFVQHQLIEQQNKALNSDMYNWYQTHGALCHRKKMPSFAKLTRSTKRANRVAMLWNLFSGDLSYKETEELGYFLGLSWGIEEYLICINKLFIKLNEQQKILSQVIVCAALESNRVFALKAMQEYQQNLQDNKFLEKKKLILEQKEQLDNDLLLKNLNFLITSCQINQYSKKISFRSLFDQLMEEKSNKEEIMQLIANEMSNAAIYYAQRIPPKEFLLKHSSEKKFLNQSIAYFNNMNAFLLKILFHQKTKKLGKLVNYLFKIAEKFNIPNQRVDKTNLLIIHSVVNKPCITRLGKKCQFAKLSKDIQFFKEWLEKITHHNSKILRALGEDQQGTVIPEWTLFCQDLEHIINTDPFLELLGKASVTVRGIKEQQRLYGTFPIFTTNILKEIAAEVPLSEEAYFDLSYEKFPSQRKGQRAIDLKETLDLDGILSALEAQLQNNIIPEIKNSKKISTKKGIEALYTRIRHLLYQENADINTYCKAQALSLTLVELAHKQHITIGALYTAETWEDLINDLDPIQESPSLAL